MDYGVAIFSTEYAIRPDVLARMLEERGFESLWLPEHTHIPACRRTPFPDGPVLPEEYWHTYDPFVALTAAALATTRLKVATGICLVVERDPIITAKQVATLDQFSNGRFIFGVGGGWNAEEMENHGTEFGKRWRVLRERILAMKEIWTGDEAEFHGEFVNFDKIWSYPKPLQKPHPPIILGAGGSATLDRIAEFCDGWMPIAPMPANIAEQVATLRRRAEAAGRDPDSISVSFYDTEPKLAVVDQLERAGVGRVIFLLPSASRETISRLLDEYASLIR
ncbi:MAG TPA: LLM class F420-dependent oxidoreductase [Blastocatellia bacterium]|jgi:probable F420-dependent oxidoreductase|nr:LLM class F420-dependent oxidoreductase [Blastocatellia bacterium]